jgi:hypothetical protein
MAIGARKLHKPRLRALICVCVLVGCGGPGRRRGPGLLESTAKGVGTQGAEIAMLFNGKTALLSFPTQVSAALLQMLSRLHCCTCKNHTGEERCTHYAVALCTAR